MRTRRIGTAALPVAMTVLVASAAAIGVAAQQETEPWVHVAMSGDSGETLNLNLPLAAIEAAIALAPEAIVRDGQVQLGGAAELPIAAIRGMWQELIDVGDVEFVTIQAGGNDLRIAREGEIILITVNESGDETAETDVRIEIPVPVVDALLSSQGDTLNIRAAVQELSTLRGEMVRVVADDNNIPIWIDESPVQ